MVSAASVVAAPAMVMAAAPMVAAAPSMMAAAAALLQRLVVLPAGVARRRLCAQGGWRRVRAPQSIGGVRNAAPS
jgi:hypothetical protein